MDHPLYILLREAFFLYLWYVIGVAILLLVSGFLLIHSWLRRRRLRAVEPTRHLAETVAVGQIGEAE